LWTDYEPRSESITLPREVKICNYASEHALSRGVLESGSRQNVKRHGDWLQLDNVQGYSRSCREGWISLHDIPEVKKQLKEMPVETKAMDLPEGLSDLVFICGAGRSGTTVLTDLLGCHADLSPCYETEFIADAIKMFCEWDKDIKTFERKFRQLVARECEQLRRGDLEKAPHEKFIHGADYKHFEKKDAHLDKRFKVVSAKNVLDDLTEQFLLDIKKDNGEILGSFRRFCLELFAVHARNDGKRVVLNKTPSYADILPLLGDLFPQAKIINCVRDGRGVAKSVIQRPFGPNTMEEAALWWADRVESAHIWALTHPTRLLTVKYESLLTAPKDELAKIFKFLEVDDKTEEILEVTDGKTEYRRGDQRSTLDPERAWAWQNEPQDNFKPFTSSRCQTILRDLGYEVKDTGNAEEVVAEEAEHDQDIDDECEEQQDNSRMAAAARGGA